MERTNGILKIDGLEIPWNRKFKYIWSIIQEGESVKILFIELEHDS